MLEILSHPWHWAVAGVLIGLTVPALLLLGNKHFGISANLRHICAACIPANIPFFKYDWKKEIWNLFFVGGIIVGAFIAATVLKNPAPMEVHPDLVQELATYGVTDHSELEPVQLFNWQALMSVKGILMFALGGFLVGFGTRYGGGCTSGHAISGLSNLQLPSLIATICFMLGGFIAANLLVPIIMQM